MSCQRCGARCQGGLCQQCEVERQFEHMAEELAADDEDDEVSADA